MNAEQLFAHIWNDYIQITPSAHKIQQLLGQGRSIQNDHIALRTFNSPELGLSSLSQHFEALGYREGGDYFFEKKKLSAKHFQHPDPNLPKVFISELLLERCSEKLQHCVSDFLASMPNDAMHQANVLYSGRHWPIRWSTYTELLQESEYAAWVYVWGFRANHFTVSVNALADCHTLQAVNQQLTQAGFVLNESGGTIKGSSAVGLEQSSTIADQVKVQFEEKEEQVPSCFYEFALRHPKGDEPLYQGFVTESADKIFESTNRRS